MSKIIFKVGEKVFDIQIGWGVITNIFNEGKSLSRSQYPITAVFDTGEETYTEDGKWDVQDKVARLSFTEYNYTDGGFSQTPPIRKGDVIYVKENSDIWQMRIFSHWFNGTPHTYINQNWTGETEGKWTEWNVRNPLLKS